VVLGQPEALVSLFTATFALVAMLALPVVNWVAARRTKGFAYRLAMATLAVMLPGLFLIGLLPGLDATIHALVHVALLGVPMAALLVLPNPIIGDIVDEDETRTGLRREGVYYGVEETLNKFGFALSAVLLGLVLDVFGASSERPLGIRLVGPIAGIGVLIGLVVFQLGYRLPDRIPPPDRANARPLPTLHPIAASTGGSKLENA
jgi:GPH family glycoside/pentoside/hexuronide:cation symporter